MPTMTKKKSPSPVDVHVGSRVRMRRMMLGLSQEKLGNGLDLTFQQVQKYEKGTNRIGASRLRQIGTILQVPESFFFEGAPGIAPGTGKVTKETPEFVTEFLATTAGLSIARSFTMIANPKNQRLLATIAETLAGLDN